MDEEIIKNFGESLRKLIETTNGTSYEFDELGNELTQEEIKARRKQDSLDAAAKRLQAREKEEFEKSVEKWSKLGTSAVTMAGKMTSQEGAFNTMGDITASIVKGISQLLGKIPIVGGVLQGLGEAGAEMVKMVTEATGKAFQTFEKISGSGVVSSFTDMQNASNETGLMYSQLESVLTKNTQILNAFGQNTLDGSKNLQKILKINYESNENFYVQAQKLGIGFQEFAEMQSSYIIQQTQAGFSRGKTDKMLAAGAREYANELDLINKLTGKKRKDIMAAQERLLTQAQFRAKIAEWEKEGPEGIRKAENVKKFLSSLPPQFEEGMMQIIVSGGAITTQAAKDTAQAIAIGGGNAQDLAKRIESGNLEWTDAMTEVTGALKIYVEKTIPLAKLVGPDSSLTKLFNEAADLALLAGRDFRQVAAEREAERKRQQANADKAAEVANAAQKIARNIEAALTSPGVIIAANEKVAAALILFGNTLNRILGNPAISVPAGPVDTLAGRRRGTERFGMNKNIYDNPAALEQTAFSRSRQGTMYAPGEVAASTAPPGSGTAFNTPGSPVTVGGAKTTNVSIPAAKNGALVQPKMGGTLVQIAEAGQPEAVVPLPDGRTIPVTIANGDNTVLVDELIKLSNKYDSIINLIYQGNVMQNDYLKAVV